MVDANAFFAFKPQLYPAISIAAFMRSVTFVDQFHQPDILRLSRIAIFPTVIPAARNTIKFAHFLNAVFPLISLDHTI